MFTNFARCVAAVTTIILIAGDFVLADHKRPGEPQTLPAKKYFAPIARVRGNDPEVVAEIAQRLRMENHEIYVQGRREHLEWYHGDARNRDIYNCQCYKLAVEAEQARKAEIVKAYRPRIDNGGQIEFPEVMTLNYPELTAKLSRLFAQRANGTGGTGTRNCREIDDACKELLDKMAGDLRQEKFNPAEFAEFTRFVAVARSLNRQPPSRAVLQAGR